MDSREVLDIATEYISLANKKYTIKRAFLFGSWVKGNPGPHSDIDIAVVLNDYSDRFETQVELMHLTKYVDTRIEPHPFKNVEFNNSDSFAYEILTSGIELKINKSPIFLNEVAEEQAEYKTTPNK